MADVSQPQVQTQPQVSSEAQSSLKHLDFVNSYSDRALNLSSSYYAWGKTQLPANIKTQLEDAEKRVFEIGDPYIRQSQGLYKTALENADFRVDRLLDVAQFYQGRLLQQREALYQQLQQGFGLLKERFPGLTSTVERQVNDAQQVPGEVQERAKTLQARLLQAWNELLKDPRVQEASDKTKPQVEQTKNRIKETQAKILADERYAKLYGTLAEYAKTVQSNDYYKALESRFGPIVKTYAGRVISDEQSKAAYDILYKNVTPFSYQDQAKTPITHPVDTSTKSYADAAKK